MLSGVKLIPRDQLNRTLDIDINSEKREKISRKKRQKKRKTNYSSSESEEFQRIRKNSRSKKRYSSSGSPSTSSKSSSESDFDSAAEQQTKPKKLKERHYSETSSYEEIKKTKRKQKKKGHQKKRPQTKGNYLSEFLSSSESENEENEKIEKHEKEQYKGRNDYISDGGKEEDEEGVKRKDMGLEWMLKPLSKPDTRSEEPEEEHQVDEVMEPNQRELNPYLKNKGSGYPEDKTQTGASTAQLLPSSVVGDGGASWRLKALKRAKEQAAREGRKFDEVVEERWGSLSQMAFPVASQRAAPARAHLSAIKDRKKGSTEKCDDQMRKSSERIGENHHEYLKDVSVRHPKMKEPKVHDSLSWGKMNGQKMSRRGDQISSNAASSLNQFADDGSFIEEFSRRQKNDNSAECGSSHMKHEKIERSDVPSSNSSISVVSKSIPTGNQLAAKVMQLRMKGKNEEAESLLKEAETMAVGDEAKAKSIGGGNACSQNRLTGRGLPSQQRKMEDDADAHLARRILQNKQYTLSGQADDEYDFDDMHSKEKKRNKQGASEQRSADRKISTRIHTQQDRCQFCFENPTRPKHLIVSIAYYTYLMLPQWQPIVAGHCCILTKEHESATRSIDDTVWEEIRNFKKCLIMMYSKQEKDLLFLETVLGLAKQRRHCMVECIPLPRGGAEEARIYFKKAIDEATGDWSQHNAKRLISTGEKGLRASIPKDFPYFHVEFGLGRGYVHVIDDESRFNPNLGLNVVRGMLGLPEEDMYRRRRKWESVDIQKRDVASFAQEWEPFDWTKQL